MRKIIVSEFITLDGVIEKPGELGWAFRFARGDEGDAVKAGEIRDAGALLLGRTTYDGFAQAWPGQTGEFADTMNAMPKYVVSSTLEKPGWDNTTVITLDDVAELKRQPGEDILVNGSARLVQALAARGLVDEYRLMVYPIVLGGGQRLFADGAAEESLRLVDARPVGDDGIVLLTYRPRHRTATSADGTSIAYDRVGAGPAVILVQGAFSSRNDPIMTGIAAALASKFTVYNYDRRGRGDSADTAPYAVRREIEDLTALIEAAGGTAMVFGGSSGGALALEAAAAGAPITKLAVFEPPYVTAPGHSLPSADELGVLAEQGRRGDAIELFLTKGAEMPPEAVEGMKAQPFWAHLEGVAHTLAYEAAVVGAGPVPERLSAVRVPTLVLAGSASSDRMRDAAQAVTGQVPDARLEWLVGQAHGQVDPASIGTAVGEFFSA
ncbi:alpha/beta fold hydrolase [Actinomadura sp. KC216]|uniref:alpha/beta fold hydrolase n=1 Tax=Actinomadura sp. KC216 TaxID=2530370 RepID=UPI001043397D|nr:alpha/beta fold hydrolase [Actinomadura sp. KC216]TDB83632.1 alpha/beta fold hydrolase [Actinomadura sp. KC216]